MHRTPRHPTLPHPRGDGSVLTADDAEPAIQIRAAPFPRRGGHALHHGRRAADSRRHGGALARQCRTRTNADYRGDEANVEMETGIA
jgi:hypothetical protein